MTSPDLSSLFLKLLNNTCSDEEAALIVDLLADENNQAFFNQLIQEQLEKDFNEQALSEIMRGRLDGQLKIILSQAVKPKKNHPSIYGMSRKRLSFAAAILLISFTTGLCYFLINKKDIQNTIVGHSTLPILPGTNKAVLTLANGRQIVLDDMANGKIAQQAAMRIEKTKDGQLVYEADSQSLSGDDVPGKSELFNTISTPKGGQYQVVLPDGTKVWLNAASSLKFPAVFNDIERKVELSGEAYFEVARISARSLAKGNKGLKNVPFIVVSNHQKIEVLGTHFNVNAYADEPDTKTTILEGSVQVSAGSFIAAEEHALITKALKAGEQSQISGEELVISHGNAESAIAWKSGKFQFENEPIESVMRKIARWYDVDIDYRGNMDKKIFSGTISKYDDVKEVLKMLQLTGTVNFKINERRIIVMS